MCFQHPPTGLVICMKRGSLPEDEEEDEDETPFCWAASSSLRAAAAAAADRAAISAARCMFSVVSSSCRLASSISC